MSFHALPGTMHTLIVAALLTQQWWYWIYLSFASSTHSNRCGVLTFRYHMVRAINKTPKLGLDSDVASAAGFGDIEKLSRVEILMATEKQWRCESALTVII